ncbi:Lactonase, 7-bladed beta-propeller-domain-containing protein [Aspergillus alliaceus]|uniref:Lactonase, 7-bladed beta-propeller-domain-containing protein n=1 Tax=Petromyces alliaceus TaxID=209559 RepID=UPI0012A61670|nr:Lactonase, 7-bladed beta-propeller-domain-containing protein [Aspergillus alliaceus]KAB8228815.1 Lactonase, 7-bladed beta-propeller-domain-containing protein [Aspergillus alliaceus]
MALRNLLTFSLALPTFSIAATLYATHYDGNVYKLSLEGEGDEVSLKQTQALQTCGKALSWLTVDLEHGLLWCSDEPSSGSLTSLEIGNDGALKEMVKVAAPNGGVNSIIYPGENGKNYLSIAHYKIVWPYEVLNFTLDNPGKAPQDQSRPHQALLDPTGSFLISPDLGADLVRVFLIDKESGKLHAGPRFGEFMDSAKDTREGNTTLYMVEELGDRLCSFEELSCFVPYPGYKLPTNTATLSSIQVNNHSLHISVRKDGELDGKDSLVTLKLASDGTVIQEQSLFPSGGIMPRTLAINKKGDYVAVANQETSNVVIAKRDFRARELLKEVASLQVGLVPQPGQWMGLSSILWYE